VKSRSEKCWRENLLRRVFNPDSEHGPNCGGKPELVAAILEQRVI